MHPTPSSSRKEVDKHEHSCGKAEAGSQDTESSLEPVTEGVLTDFDSLPKNGAMTAWISPYDASIQSATVREKLRASAWGVARGTDTQNKSEGKHVENSGDELQITTLPGRNQGE